ncbi:phosphotransferase family protein [Nonomuraea wenchangensis]|uniref:Phosphotransferase enzyme family protein n=1 Tax=Nonomuraea wenchangensis TaxID=568860 RepID=A0A1I0EQB6_9ACTN|nr:phosphotransferase [Nonomuraea wenchangensis]SET47605.1 Phosphotransferase enzyme family protein [Nonomuraea wenchangensis]
MSRAHWEDMPEQAHAEVEARLGRVVKAETVEGGIMPGLACRLHMEDGRDVFLKAIQSTHPGATLHRREAWAGRALPETVPAPRLLWHGDVAGWLLMASEFVGDARHADLSPGSPDLPAVLETIAGLGAMLTPAPGGAPPVLDNIAPLQATGRHLLHRPPGVLPDRDVYAAALARFDAGAVRGDTLLHYDLSASNLLVADGRVHVLDWSFAARGAAWMDAAMFAPRLVEAGHAPDAVDAMLSRVPSWREVPRDALVGLAALWTMFRVYKSMYGPEEVREGRARAAAAGRAWLERLAA